MRLNELEARFVACLQQGMTFEEMAVELGMTVEEVEQFGTEFWDRAFEERRRKIV